MRELKARTGESENQCFNLRRRVMKVVLTPGLDPPLREGSALNDCFLQFGLIPQS